MSIFDDKDQNFQQRMLDFIRKSSEIAAPPQGSGQISINSEQQQRALQLVQDWAQTKAPAQSPFAKVSVQEFVSDLLKRLNAPDEVNQSFLNVCGAATFKRFWIKSDPEGYAKTTLELFQNGKAQYRNVPLEVHTEMRTQSCPLNVADWLVTASLQNASGYLGYNPNAELGGVRGIALPHKVRFWLENLPLHACEHISGCTSTDVLNSVFQQGGAVAWLVNINHLDDYFTNAVYRNTDEGFTQKVTAFFGGLTGNHYIALNTPITPTADGKARFEVWTWGNSLEVIIPTSELHKCVTQTYLLRPLA